MRTGPLVRRWSTYRISNPSQPSSAPTFINQGSRTVPSEIYHDAFVTYRVPTNSAHSSLSSRLLDGIEIQLGITDVFNTKPPFEASNVLFGGYGFYYSPYGDPRLRDYWVSIKKAL